MQRHNTGDRINVDIATFGKFGLVQSVFDLGRDLGVPYRGDGAMIRVFNGITRTGGGIFHRLAGLVHGLTGRTGRCTVGVLGE